MSYEHRSNVHVKGIPLPFKIVSVIIIILLPIYLFFPKFFPNVFTFVLGPFWKIRQEEPVLSREMRDAFISELQKENTDLKTLLNTSTTSSVQTIAYILKKPPFTAYDNYIIDIGKHKDVHIGDKVYAIGNVLLGEISEIDASIAKVKLYSSYGEKYTVFIGKNNIETIATGLGGGAFEVVLPKDVKIVENDTVTIPDLRISVFGIVKSVTIDPARAFSTILFSQPLNIYEQKWVLIKNDD
ncbi:MAG: hypothetical protein Q7S72_01480 [Candidatus Taylorbacteria bacterium]|nr:hypothetical protein [Candidatus Taylorbacteria bacterium]